MPQKKDGPDLAGSDVVLPFHAWGTSCPVQYDIDYAGHNYYVRYRSSWLSVTLDIDSSDTELFTQQLSQDDLDGFWSDEATNVYLALIGRAIRDGKLAELHLPMKHEIRNHPFYRKGPYAGYDPKNGDGP
ncbi:MAG: hypothetical protein WD073_10765 [Xanthobacteraceae bacterium]